MAFKLLLVWPLQALINTHIKKKMCVLFLKTGLPNIFYSEVIDSRPKSYMWQGRKRSKTCVVCHLFMCLHVQSCLQKERKKTKMVVMLWVKELSWRGISVKFTDNRRELEITCADTVDTFAQNIWLQVFLFLNRWQQSDMRSSQDNKTGVKQTSPWQRMMNNCVSVCDGAREDIKMRRMSRI